MRPPPPCATLLPPPPSPPACTLISSFLPRRPLAPPRTAYVRSGHLKAAHALHEPPSPHTWRAPLRGGYET
eukprot:9146246-Pyramimonas_sp.AAC.1